ncbi:hypothetical protein LINPERPRIM_LOCUS15153 [Linum perenne]
MLLHIRFLSMDFAWLKRLNLLVAICVKCSKEVYFLMSSRITQLYLAFVEGENLMRLTTS